MATNSGSDDKPDLSGENAANVNDAASLVAGAESQSFTNCYYQVTVPSFGYRIPGNTSTEPLTSFLRLGAPADPSTEATSFSQGLLQVIQQASPPDPIASGVLASVEATTAGAITTGTTVQSTVYAAIASVAVDAVTGLGIGIYPNSLAVMNAAQAAGDAVLAGGGAVADAIEAAREAAVATALGNTFVDDLRNRGVNGTDESGGHGLSVAQRLQESSYLFKRGGWRDHSDGNRITTTYGDKVEVIRGNYRMIVLGRQDDGGNAAVFEASGGITDDADFAPGQVSEIKWVETQAGTWRVIEYTTKGDVDSTFDGHVVERFLGGSVTSITGNEQNGASSEPAISANALADLNNDYQAALGGGLLEASVTFAEYATERGFPAKGGSQYDYWYEQDADGNPLNRSNPIVVEKTWAHSISSYTGSTKTHVPTIYEETWADSIESHTYATTISDYVGSSDHFVDTISETKYANNINSTTGAFTNRIGSITEKEYYTNSWSESWGGGKGEVTGGAFFEAFLGAALSLRVGVPSVECSFALAAEIFVGIAFEVFLGIKIEVGLGRCYQFDAMKNYIGFTKEEVSFEQNEIAMLQTLTAALTKLGSPGVTTGAGDVLEAIPPPPPPPPVI